jgi:hypothetical protein
MRRSATGGATPQLPRWAVSAALLGAAAGCRLEPGRDLGRTLDEQSLPVVATPPRDTPFGVPASEFAGRWIGTAEDPLALGGERGAYVFAIGVFNNAVFANERQLSVPVGVVHFERAN